MTDNGSVSGPIKAVGFLSSMEVWWVGPDGSVQGAHWYEGQSWQRYQLAPPGSASTETDITAVSRIPNSMEVWWTGADGSVQAAYWYDGGQWTRYQIAGPGSAAPTGAITACSRIPNSMEVWWTGADGSVQAAYWYEGGQWTRYQIVPSATFSGRITSGGLAALGGWVEATVYSDGTTRMRGHAHDSGADGYDFGVSAILTAPNARAVAFAHTGHVGGTFTSGSRDHDWDQTYPAQALVRTQFPALAHGQFQLTTQYSSDFGSTVESVISGIVPFLLGATPVGALVGVVVFVGAEVGSLISTGSLVPGARLAGRVLWLAGPSNTC